MDERKAMEIARQGLERLRDFEKPSTRTEIFGQRVNWHYRVLSRLVGDGIIEKSGRSNNIFYRAIDIEKLNLILSNQVMLSELIWPWSSNVPEEPPGDDDEDQKAVIATMARVIGAMVDKLDRIERGMEEIKQILKVLM